jgi:putative endonuclease
MNNARQRLGRWGEKLAAKFLSNQGYLIIDQNARTQYGEIDLIALNEDQTVFVEVKTRKSTKFGYPEQSVSAVKRSHLLDSALAYIQEHPEFGDNWRVDVIAIQYFDSDKEPEIIHFEDAIK